AEALRSGAGSAGGAGFAPGHVPACRAWRRGGDAAGPDVRTALQWRGLSDHAGRPAETAQRLIAMAPKSPFSAEGFRMRALAQSPAEASGQVYGDHRFNPGHPRLALETMQLRPAAV